MKTLKQSVVSLAILSLTACSGTDEPVKQGVIDVAGAIENIQELKVSQLGNSIRFVPLETQDSSLVGNEWDFQVTDKYVLVSNK